MKLIDLLVDIFEVWPEDVVEVMQDYDGEVKGADSHGSKEDADDEHVWMRPSGNGPSFGFHPMAEDAATSLVTEKEWTLEAVRRGKKVLKDGLYVMQQEESSHQNPVIVWQGVLYPFADPRSAGSWLGIYSRVRQSGEDHYFRWCGGELIGIQSIEFITDFTGDVTWDDVIPAPKKSEAELLWDRVHSGEQRLSDGAWKLAEKENGNITFLVVVDGTIFPFSKDFGVQYGGWERIRGYIIDDRNYGSSEPSEFSAEGSLELIELFGQELETKWMVYVPDCEGRDGGPFLYRGEDYGPSVFKSEEDAEKAIRERESENGYKRESYHIISFDVPKSRGGE